MTKAVETKCTEPKKFEVEKLYIGGTTSGDTFKIIKRTGTFLTVQRQKNITATFTA